MAAPWTVEPEAWLQHGPPRQNEKAHLIRTSWWEYTESWSLKHEAWSLRPPAHSSRHSLEMLDCSMSHQGKMRKPNSIRKVDGSTLKPEARSLFAAWPPMAPASSWCCPGTIALARAWFWSPRDQGRSLNDNGPHWGAKEATSKWKRLFEICVWQKHIQLKP